MILKSLLFSLLLALPVAIEGARILIVYSTISKSHVMPLQAVAKVLAERDHDVTFVCPFPLSKPVKNLREIVSPFDEKDKDILNQVAKDPKSVSFFTMIKTMPNMIMKTGNATLQMPAMKKLMKEEKFDLLIVGYFMTEFILGLGDHFKVPTIVFSPASAMGNLNAMVGNPLSPTGAPHVLMQSIELDFVGRLKNFLAYGGETFILKPLLNYIEKQVY
jgi:glucuronosyltransferase